MTGSANPWPDLTGKSWAHKTAPEMTDDELDDAYATLVAVPLTNYEREWLRRHGLPENSATDRRDAPANPREDLT